MTATAPRSFEELVAMFRALDAEGARAEDRAQVNAATSCYQYPDDVFRQSVMRSSSRPRRWSKLCQSKQQGSAPTSLTSSSD